ncbi:23S rRNA (adenine(2030)-N(6))-methyltransferase RlmJ [Fuscibacter oryzae]|uniref:Ribosomal RNA large subunit methyltransferase J n=1 Tax=Fuscibacter oryzae TaxID=2803939 RepID=A0A8J7MM74_9RHOB|nr:23S rRNA (adenine(2030)-N(6))-methyltransferase RlmJ [Fuscibacter oryzae]MBL4927390.1 23S rRNA (adenine(2030)-N(6))-methyltransferase RlmJ [Fuscibacter oryzae]
MLSYQHAYHAGNLADVQKHALLAWMLDYLTQKDKPLSYIETHAGRGLYDLAGQEALKTGEAAAGVTLLEPQFDRRHPYRTILEAVRARYGATAYPGSPLVAAMSLREQDTMHLAELHPQEHAALVATLGDWGAHIQKRDGLELAMAITPPSPRRGLLLIDPPYEVKADYDTIPKVMVQLARKWNVGILALWYPLLTSGAHGPMLRALTEAFPEAFRQELHFPPAKDGHKMIGTGMFIVNAPWGIEAEGGRIAKMFKRLQTGEA